MASRYRDIKMCRKYVPKFKKKKKSYGLPICMYFHALIHTHLDNNILNMFITETYI